MLEIILVWWLCKKNAQRARARGKSGGWAIAYTIVLWLGMEFLGAFFGVALGLPEINLYLVAFLFAALGGVISYIISKIGEPIVKEEPKLPNGTDI